MSGRSASPNYSSKDSSYTNLPVKKVPVHLKVPKKYTLK
jgi:hypothetical protein